MVKDLIMARLFFLTLKRKALPLRVILVLMGGPYTESVVFLVRLPAGGLYFPPVDGCVHLN